MGGGLCRIGVVKGMYILYISISKSFFNLFNINVLGQYSLKKKPQPSPVYGNGDKYGSTNNNYQGKYLSMAFKILLFKSIF